MRLLQSNGNPGFFPKVVESLCVAFLSMQRSCWGIMHPSPQLWVKGWSWEQHCSFSEQCLGYVPCLFLGQAAVPSLTPSDEAAVLPQRPHCLSH